MKKPKITISIIIVCILIVAGLAPLVIMIIGGFKNEYALLKIPPDLNIFKGISLANYKIAFEVVNTAQGILNSLYYSIGSVVLNLVVCATAGYAFAKKQFIGKKILFPLVIATMIIPRQILLVPNYIVADTLKITDTLIGLILTSIAPSFGIFLCKQFMQTIPDELLEAAEIDGSNEGNSFLKIVIPMAFPALGALAIFSFMGSWNEYLWSFIFMSSKDKLTLPVVISTLSSMQKANTGARFAASTISFIPMLIIFISCQRFFIEGVTMGSVKG